MKSSTADGVDVVFSRLLKLCEDELCLPVVYIINQSLSKGVF